MKIIYVWGNWPNILATVVHIAESQMKYVRETRYEDRVCLEKSRLLPIIQPHTN